MSVTVYGTWYHKLAFSSVGALAPLPRGNGTVQRAADFPVPDGIKLQQLHILRGTQLAREYATHPFPVATLEEYCLLVKDCLDILQEEVVIHRLTGIYGTWYHKLVP